VRLGEGELTMHLRRVVDGARCRIECGVALGCVTAVQRDVTCKDCTSIAATADGLAALCGCHDGAIHTPVARAMYEIKGHFQ
jgi:molybdenum cofactor biosynthesis enzyme MoaA